MPKQTVTQERDALKAELDKIKGAVNHLIEQYGTNWCDDGVEAVREAFAGVSGIEGLAADGTVRLVGVFMKGLTSAHVNRYGRVDADVDLAFREAINKALGPKAELTFSVGDAKITVNFIDAEFENFEEDY